MLQRNILAFRGTSQALKKVVSPRAPHALGSKLCVCPARHHRHGDRLGRHERLRSKTEQYMPDVQVSQPFNLNILPSFQMRRTKSASPEIEGKSITQAPRRHKNCFNADAPSAMPLSIGAKDLNKVCAFHSPFRGILSDIGMFRQPCQLQVPGITERWLSSKLVVRWA